MSWIGWAVIVTMFGILVFVGWGILKAQKELDAPFAGLLVVDRTDDGKPLVYYQAVDNPENLINGQTIKLKVRVVKEEIVYKKQ